LIGSIAGDAIMGGSTSLGDLLLMIGVIVTLAYVFDLLEYRIPRFRAWLRDRETPLIEHGRLLRRNMRREMVTEEELMAVLRKEDIEKLSDVRSACLEADGEISVLVDRRSRKV